MIIELNSPVLTHDNTFVDSIQVLTTNNDTESLIFWVVVSVGNFTERVPIWVEDTYQANIENWNTDLLAESLKAYYENDRNLPSIIYKASKGNWDNFNLQMMSNPRFNQVYSQCLSHFPIIATALPTAIDQISSKGLTLFTLIWNQLCEIGVATVEDRETWGDIAVANNLPQEFIEILKG